MQRVTPLAPVMAAPRGLAVDGDDPGVIVAQAAHPGEEAGLEQFRVQMREHVAQRVVAGDAVRVRVKTAEERHALPSPQHRLHEIIRPRERRRQHQEHDFR